MDIVDISPPTRGQLEECAARVLEENGNLDGFEVVMHPGVWMAFVSTVMRGNGWHPSRVPSRDRYTLALAGHVLPVRLDQAAAGSVYIMGRKP
jgi:hypothetical protein